MRGLSLWDVPVSVTSICFKGGLFQFRHTGVGEAFQAILSPDGKQLSQANYFY